MCYAGLLNTALSNIIFKYWHLSHSWGAWNRSSRACRVVHKLIISYSLKWLIYERPYMPWNSCFKARRVVHKLIISDYDINKINNFRTNFFIRKKILSLYLNIIQSINYNSRTCKIRSSRFSIIELRIFKNCCDTILILIIIQSCWQQDFH